MDLTEASRKSEVSAPVNGGNETLWHGNDNALVSAPNSCLTGARERVLKLDGLKNFRHRFLIFRLHLYSGFSVYIVTKNKKMQILTLEVTNMLLGIFVNLTRKSLK